MRTRSAITLCLVAVWCGSATAWGPHTEITSAALDVLPNRGALRQYLGDDFARLARDYCWTGDWQEAVRPDHYADDHLLFPGSPRHVSHIHPAVRMTYAPYFRRALQAVRTESPQNAARWVGSLLHFVQDAGSPPHTTGIGGELHGKMERWVDETRITIAGYKPVLLGRTDADALKGLEDRMADLHDFAKSRAQKLRPLVEQLEVRTNQALELECANEVARVTADVVHTLFTLGRKRPEKVGAGLEGKLNYTPPPGYATVPAKVILLGTDFSTTTDGEGRYRFRDLPPGTYDLAVFATGHEVAFARGVVLAAGKTATVEPKLKPDAVPGNLVRNPRFALKWIAPSLPDGWTREGAKPARWASAPVRVPVGQKCEVRVDFAGEKPIPVSVRWRTNPSSVSGSREIALDTAKLPAVVAPDPLLKPFEPGYLYLQVLLHTDDPPEAAVRHVAVTLVKK